MPDAESGLKRLGHRAVVALDSIGDHKFERPGQIEKSIGPNFGDLRLVLDGELVTI